MESCLEEIMNEYLENVNSVCINLLKGFDLKNKYEFFEYRKAHNLSEFNVNGIQYRLHGKGCVAFNEKFFINWDFGYRSRWCGIDPWLIAITLKQNKNIKINYYDGNLIKEACDQAMLDGRMFKVQNQYYFLIPISDTFKPEFPKEFDTLIIEHFGAKMIIPRNKTIDKFLRKSTRIYNELDNSPNPYTLRFISDGYEVFNIKYDDIGYPENAIKIMDDILRESYNCS